MTFVLYHVTYKSSLHTLSSIASTYLRVATCKALTGKILEFWIGVAAYEKWSHMKFQLYVSCYIQMLMYFGWTSFFKNLYCFISCSVTSDIVIIKLLACAAFLED